MGLSPLLTPQIPIWGGGIPPGRGCRGYIRGDGRVFRRKTPL